MIRTLVGLVVCAASFAIKGAQVSTSDTDLSCIASLALPTTGAFAARAGTSGTVRATITIGKGGELAKLDLDGKNPVLNAEVRVAMNMSAFVARCEDRTIAILFSFTLKDPMTDYILPPAVRFVPPNRFELTFSRVKPITEMPARESRHMHRN